MEFKHNAGGKEEIRKFMEVKGYYTADNSKASDAVWSEKDYIFVKNGH